MEFKCTDPNGGIVLASELHHAKKTILKKGLKLHSEMNPTSYFFQEDAATT